MCMQNKVRLITISVCAAFLLAGGAYAIFRSGIGADSVNENFNLVDTTITWDTPLQDTKGGIVEYGLTDQYELPPVTEDITEPAKSHTVVLTDLIPEKTYHYRIKTTDPDKTSDDQTFTTLKCTSESGNCNDNGNGNGNDNDNGNGNGNGNGNDNGNDNGNGNGNDNDNGNGNGNDNGNGNGNDNDNGNGNGNDNGNGNGNTIGPICIADMLELADGGGIYGRKYTYCCSTSYNNGSICAAFPAEYYTPPPISPTNPVPPAKPVTCPELLPNSVKGFDAFMTCEAAN